MVHLKSDWRAWKLESERLRKAGFGGLPSPDEIAARAAAIRRSWDPHTRAMRKGVEPPVETQVVAVPPEVSRLMR